MNDLEKVWTIRDIEGMTESDAQEMAVDSLEIKGHAIYFVDFGGYFGYSCLVFADGKHIYFANDYQLHHKDGTPEALREMYISRLQERLFTRDELTAPLHDYMDYSRRRDYIRNLYPLRREHISAFFCGSEEERADRQKKIMDMRFSDVAMAYYDREYDSFVDDMHALYDSLEAARKEADKDPEYMRSAFLYEMYNHEYGINWEADYDVLSCFGSIRYAGCAVESYFDQLHFPPEIKRAYMDARREYCANASL